MSDFAFAGRVSTEDLQDPEASRAWQRRRAEALIMPHGGRIVAEYFDIGQSRSLPWKRRPHAAVLLAALKDPHRGFDAVVIGEPQRMFYGNQFSLVFPLFEHYGVPLWVPEVGGPIDPGSDAHDLVMSIYGGASKAERNRIKIRVRASMEALAATEGRFLGGRPPYGYLLADGGPHPNPAKAADGKRLHTLAADPVAAPVVARIYREYLAGHGLGQIAEGLTRDGIPSPSAHDPQRNRHRCGIAWSKAAIRVILTNPRYTGRQVWNKQRKDEVLIDVDDVALGHETRMRWNDQQRWVYSQGRVHPALVSDEDFEAVQDLLASRTRNPAARQPRATPRPYVLRGLMFCGLCNRRMQGSWNNGQSHYRCVFPQQYALANKVDHPRSLYLREAQVLRPLDTWLAEAFAPSNLARAITALHVNQDLRARPSGPEQARRDEAQRTIADCDARLERYRKALEAGTDPALIATWTAEVNVQRAAAEQILAQAKHDRRARRLLTPDEIDRIIRTAGSLVCVLPGADADKRAEVYRQLGLKLTYHPAEKTVIAEANASAIMYQSECPRGDLNPHAR